MILERGAKGTEVRAIQEILNFLHFQGRKSTAASADFRPLDADGIFGNDTEEAVSQFQEAVGLYSDGRVGPVTIQALQAAYGIRQNELTAPLSTPSDDQLSVEKGPADAYKDGYDRVRLRSDTMIAYRKVYKEVNRRGGLLTSSGGIRDLNAEVGPGRSATSFHYSGRALDLMIYSGMVDPKTDPYVVQRLGNRSYKVFARCDGTRAASGALPPAIIVDDVVTYKNRIKGITVEDHFLDLTKVFESMGFRPIRARANFESGGNQIGAEWWHFQYEVGLVPGVTTFGSELLKIYSEQRLKTTPPWNYKDYIFKIDWA